VDIKKITDDITVILLSTSSRLFPLVLPHNEADESPANAPNPSSLLSCNTTEIIRDKLDASTNIEKNVVILTPPEYIIDDY